ncbi:MAG: glycosyltransferase family 2 protein, partial [Acidimicrobiales bacterium]
MSAGQATLRVQTVLFRSAPGDVARFAGSVAAACAHARGTGAISAAELAIGDSSEAPLAVPADELVGHGASAPQPFSRVDYLHFGENLGSAGGHNRLFADAESDLVLVTNPDTYASPRLVTELVRGLDDPSV